MKKICIVTSNRAEYGLLTPLIKGIEEDSELELQLIVTGAHLSEKYGKTINQIVEDGFPIAAEIPILETENTSMHVSFIISNTLRAFAEFFYANKPDAVVLLGDRTEILGVAIAAMNENLTIVHIHGGEVTEGAVDDCVRHALTKMSYLHFTGTEKYRNRVIQLGENPNRVFNVGTLSAENILTVPLMTESQIRREIDIPYDCKYVLVTLHPETVDGISSEKMANMLCECMKKNSDIYFVITSSNSDAGGDEINRIFMEFAKKHDNVQYVVSLGMIRYLSALQYAMFVLGNSSSGIVEAPILGVPTVNVGERQKGRIMTKTILQVPFEVSEILSAMNLARYLEHTPSKIYGDGTTSKQIIKILKKYLFIENIDLKKGFYDL